MIHAIRSKPRQTSDSEIASILASKRKDPMEDMIKRMEEKYGRGGQKKKKRKKKEKEPEIDDEEFERIRAGLGGK